MGAVSTSISLKIKRKLTADKFFTNYSFRTMTLHSISQYRLCILFGSNVRETSSIPLEKVQNTYLESGENVPLDLGDTGQHIGGGDLTKRE